MLGFRTSLRTQLFGICSIGLIGLVAAAMVTVLLIERVRVGGPVYAEVKLGQDLVADILPPPAYLLESYLTCFEALAADTPQRVDEQLTRGEALLKGAGGYRERIEYWKSNLPAGELREALLGPSVQAADRFILLRDSEFSTLMRAGKRAEAQVLLATTMKAAYDQHRLAIDKVVTLTNERNVRVEASVESDLRHGWILFGSIVVGALTVSVSLIWWSSRSIIGSVASTGQVVQRVAQGDLSGKATELRRDELGTLAKGVNRMVSDLRSLVSRTATSGQEVIDQAGTMDGLATTACSGVAQSSVRMQGMTAAVEEITVNFSAISSNINDFTVALNEISEKSSSTSGHSRQAGDIIQKATSEANNLGDSIHHIQGMSTLIREIAEQTNLLALNASIEAASAGEHGRGFAVVANEVKLLAKKTSEATEQIEKLSQEVLVHSNGVGTSVSSVNVIMQQVSDAQNSISHAISDQTKTINDISGVMKEAVSAMQEVSVNVVGLDGELKKIGVLSDQASVASHQLKVVATTMQDAVKQFRW